MYTEKICLWGVPTYIYIYLLMVIGVLSGGDASTVGDGITVWRPNIYRGGVRAGLTVFFFRYPKMLVLQNS